MASTLAVNPLRTVHQTKKKLETVDHVEKHQPKNWVSPIDKDVIDAFVLEHFDDGVFRNFYSFGHEPNGG